MKRSIAVIIFVALLLSLHLALAASSVISKSNTFDELNHITAGYSYWKYNDYRFHQEIGNFPQRWVALPLLFMDLAFPETESNLYDAAHEFFFRIGNDGEAMLFQGRMMVLGLSLFLGLGVYFWSSRIFGLTGGLISLALYCFSPSILAHGRLATSDLATALFFTFSVGAIWKLLHRITLFNVVAAALAVSGLLLSKMSGLLIVPISFYMVMAKVFRGVDHPIYIGKHRQVRSLKGQVSAVALTALGVGCISIVFIWGAYGFRYASSSETPDDRELPDAVWSVQLEGTGSLQPTITFMRGARVLPEAYLYGFTSVLSNTRARGAFLLGQYSYTGWWYFFPFCFAVKTPLTTLILLSIAMMAIIRASNRKDWYALSPLFCFSAVYWAVAMSSSINIGHRHILPIYPAMFIIAGATARWYPYYKKAFIFMCLAFASVLVLETQWIYPHYLAFFNTAAGGPANGYRLLVDSSLDWGQDLPGIGQWIGARHQMGKTAPIYLAYFGTASPAYYHVNARIIPVLPFSWLDDVSNRAESFEPGYYCISATELQQVHGLHGPWNQILEDEYWLVRKGMLHGDDSEKRRDAVGIRRLEILRFARLANYLKQREPETSIGYSILIYKLNRYDLDSALNQPYSEWKNGNE